MHPPTPAGWRHLPTRPPGKTEFLSPSLDPPSQESGSNTKYLSLLLLHEAAKPWLSWVPFGKLFLFLMGLEELAFILSDCSVSPVGTCTERNGWLHGNRRRPGKVFSSLPDFEELLTRALFGSGFCFK